MGIPRFRFQMTSAAGAALDPYSVLDVPSHASIDEIRRQYRCLLLRHHPDKAGGEVTSAKYWEICVAWDILGNAERRREYDEGRRKRKDNREGGRVVSEEVCLEEMEEERTEGVDGSGKTRWRWECRCGGEFVLDEHEMRVGDEEIIVGCGGCSLGLKVTWDEGTFMKVLGRSGE